jgi:hypothetical protein
MQLDDLVTTAAKNEASLNRSENDEASCTNGGKQVHGHYILDAVRQVRLVATVMNRCAWRRTCTSKEEYSSSHMHTVMIASTPLYNFTLLRHERWPIQNFLVLVL